MEHLLQESNLHSVFAKLPFQTKAGSTAILSFFEHLPKFQTIVHRRSNTILDMRPLTASKDLQTDWGQLKLAEEQLKPYIQTSTDLTEQVEAEVFFTNPHLKVLNTVPFVLTILLAMKIFIAPILGICMPILVFIVPYVIVRYIMRLPMPWEVYCGMVLEMMAGIKPGEPFGLKQLAQLGYFIVSFGQGMVQPILTSMQTRKTDATIQTIGSLVIRYMNLSQKLYKLLLSTSKIRAPPFDIPTDPRLAYWWLRENQTLFIAWQKQIGCLDVYWTLASDPSWKPVSWSPGLLYLEGLSDLCIQENPVKSSLELTNHSLLTGPNRGGKSSSLRAILQQVLFARVFGVSSCDHAAIPWYTWIHSRIRSLDSPGERSLFEEDVRSCASVLGRAQQSSGEGLVLIDELFHSTNPPDALFCARVFLKEFWKTTTTMSVISTHSFELLKEVPSTVALISCPAKSDPSTGQLQYSYKLSSGICMLSSVREVLREAGFPVA